MLQRGQIFVIGKGMATQRVARLLLLGMAVAGCSRSELSGSGLSGSGNLVGTDASSGSAESGTRSATAARRSDGSTVRGSGVRSGPSTRGSDNSDGPTADQPEAGTEPNADTLIDVSAPRDASAWADTDPQPDLDAWTDAGTVTDASVGTSGDSGLGSAACGPHNCADDGNPCNGTALCDPATGDCTHTEAPLCDDGIFCNGEERCDTRLGCMPANEPACNLAHGTCSEEQRRCSCDFGYYGDDCYVVALGFEGFGSVLSISVQEDLLWMGTDLGLWVLDHGGSPEDFSDDRSLLFTRIDGLTGLDEVHSTRLDPGGGLWVTSGYLNYFAPGPDPFDKSDDQWLDYTDQAAIDRSERTGLNLTVIYALDVDSEGVVWLSPSRHTARRLDPNGTPLLPGDDTWQIFDESPEQTGGPHTIGISPDSVVWWSSRDQLSAFDPETQTWQTFTPQSTGLDLQYFLAVHPVGAQHVWIAVDASIDDFHAYGNAVALLDHNGTIADQTDDRWMLFENPDGLGAPNQVSVDSAGIAWVAGSSQGLARLDIGADASDPSDDSFTITADISGGLNTVVPRSATELWLGGSGGLSYLDHRGTANTADDRLVSYVGLSSPLSDAVFDIAIDAQGAKWLTTRDALSYLDDGGTPLDRSDDQWMHFERDDLPSTAGLRMVSISPTGPKYLIARHTSSLEQLQVLHDAGTPRNKTDDTWLVYPDIPSHDISDMMIDAEGYLRLVSERDGLHCLDDGGTPLDQQDDSWVTLGSPEATARSRSISKVPAGLWLGASTGLYHWDEAGTACDVSDDVISKVDSGPNPGRGIESLSADGMGGLWVRFEDTSDFAYYHPGERFDDSADDAWTFFDAGSSVVLASLEVGPGGQVWLGSHDTIQWLDPRGTPLDPSDDLFRTATRGELPLHVDSIYAITPDPQGGVWLATQANGLSYVDLDPRD